MAKLEKIRRELISQGYYSYDHATSIRVIKDILKANTKVNKIKKANKK